MARANPPLVEALQATARRLRDGSDFAWGHMGRCNCGHLAQTLTHQDAAAIHRAAQERHGDWSTQTREYCPTSGLEIDHLIHQLLAAGLTLSDLRLLEDLADPQILAQVPARHLRRSDRTHAALYFEAWAELLESQLPPRLTSAPTPVSSPRCPTPYASSTTRP